MLPVPGLSFPCPVSVPGHHVKYSDDWPPSVQRVYLLQYLEATEKRYKTGYWTVVTSRDSIVNIFDTLLRRYY
jgi:hypothetical protein